MLYTEFGLLQLWPFRVSIRRVLPSLPMLMTSYLFIRTKPLSTSGGGVSVELFFIISGYVHYFFYFEQIKDGVIRGRIFWLKKITRLYPLYWFTTIIIVILKFFSLYSIGEIMVSEAANNFSLCYILLNILGIARGWLENESYPYNGVAWSMSVDIFLYIIFFCLAKVVKKENLHKIIIYVLVFVGIYVIERGMQYPIINVEMSRGILCFFVGGQLYNLEKDIGEKKYRNVIVIIGSFILLFIFSPILRRDYYLQTLILFPGIIMVAKYFPLANRILRNRWLVLGGKLSFSIYLNQKPLMVFLYTISKKYYKIDFYSKGFWCFYIILLLSVSIFTYTKIEQKGSKLITKYALKLGIEI